MLKAAGLEPMPELLQRKEALRKLAVSVSQNDVLAPGDASQPDITRPVRLQQRR